MNGLNLDGFRDADPGRPGSAPPPRPTAPSPSTRPDDRPPSEAGGATETTEPSRKPTARPSRTASTTQTTPPASERRDRLNLSVPAEGANWAREEADRQQLFLAELVLDLADAHGQKLVTQLGERRPRRRRRRSAVALTQFTISVSEPERRELQQLADACATSLSGMVSALLDTAQGS